MINKPFKEDHIDLINTKINYPSLDVLKMEVCPYEGDEALTYISDDKVIFACGMKVIRQGVAHVWVIPSIHVDNYAKTFYKEINFLLNSYVEKMSIHRVQTTITKDFVKWIELLGFKRESTLKQITFDKKDEYLYTKFY